MNTSTAMWLANAVLVVHWAFVLFVVGGQALILTGWWRGWGWTRNRVFRVSHLLAILLVVAETWLGFACPLTTLEDVLRGAAHIEGAEMGFIARWLRGLLFYHAPAWVFVLAYSGFALLVIASFVWYPPRRGTQAPAPRAK